MSRQHEAVKALLATLEEGRVELLRLERMRDDAIGAYDRQARKVRLLSEGVDVLEKALAGAAQRGELEFPEIIETAYQMALPWPKGTQAVDSEGQNVFFLEGAWRFHDKAVSMTGQNLPFTNVEMGS
jgi:hypothetical protein